MQPAPGERVGAALGPGAARHPHSTLIREEPEMMARVTPDNLHSEVDAGPPV
jgi:hypothetical protein